MLLLSGLLVFSGACALVFQLVWIRELRLIFGATTSASGAVMAIFMAGLGIGNALFGRIVDRLSNPLRCYALLELGIALSAAMTPLGLDWVRAAYIDLGGQASLGFFGATLFRLVAAGFLLLIPTICMGGTLPACARVVTGAGDTTRRGVGVLYGVNTLGAVAGAFLASFFLLEQWGNRQLLWTACGVNLAVASLAWFASQRALFRLHGDSEVPRESSRRDRSVPDLAWRSGLAWRWRLWAFAAVVGLVFFLMEIVWYRLLGPLLGGTTYTFSLILCSALLGMGVGGAIYGALGKRIHVTPALLGWTCALEGLGLAVPYALGDRIAMGVLERGLQEPLTFASQVLTWVLVTMVVVFPAALVAGFQFPLLIALAGQARQGIGRDVGRLFAANTLGAIVGSLSGGFFLLPAMTAPGLWRLAVLALIILAVLIFAGEFRAAIRPRGWVYWIGWLGIGASVWMIFAFPGPTAVWRHSQIGARRLQVSMVDPLQRTAWMYRQRRLPVWEAEGIETSIAINAVDSLSFIVNGKSDGNSYGDSRTQIGSALIGPLLQRESQTGLVIGLGTGQTAGWLASVEGMERVDVVELEPRIVTMAERCAAMNQEILKNNRVRLFFNDAREFLVTTRESYDLILSEPSNPYRSGVANLYTQEFYRSVAQRLQPKGLFLQWIQGYEVDTRTIEIAMATLRSVFPRLQVWVTQSRDILFVCGADDAFAGQTLEGMAERLGEETIREGLRLTWRTVDIEGVCAHFICSEQTIDELFGKRVIPLNTDDRNLLEFAFAKSLGEDVEFSLPALLAVALQRGDRLPLPTSLQAGTLPDEFWARVMRRRLASYVLPGGYVPPLEGLSMELVQRREAYNAYLSRDYPEARRRLEGLDVDPQCPAENLLFAHVAIETGGAVEDEVLARLRRDHPPEALALEAWRLYQGGQVEASKGKVLEAFQQMRRDPWGMTQVLDLAFRTAVSVVGEDRQFAAALFSMIDRPLAVYRGEERRRVLRYILAQVLGDAELRGVIESFEPYPIWEDWFLATRVRVYDSVEHRLAARARRDWEQFQRARAQQLMSNK